MSSAGRTMPLFHSGARRRALMFLLLAASVMVPALAGAQATGGVRRRACADCEAEARRERALQRLDSLRTEFEHEKLTATQRRALEREVVVALRELESAARDMTLEQHMARAQALAATPRVAYSYTQRQPHGYLGVTFDGPNTEELRNDQRFIRFLAYPRIQLVEPSSPADRAGIRIGDTLVAMNGVDVQENEISLTKMLVPDEPLAVKLRRDGLTHDLRVVVGRAPQYVVQRWSPGPAVAAEAQGAIGERTPQPTRVTVGVAPAPQAREPRPAMTSVWVFTDGVAGAKVETVTPGLGKALGVAGGVLVTRAGPGTPAQRAGLSDGDIIVRAAGQRVNSVRELRVALDQHDHGDGVKLVILRERKQKEVTLRQ
jgi:predicted metalloprotease with PDZ domain